MECVVDMRIKLCIGLCATASAVIVTTSVLSSREGLAVPPHEAARAAMASEGVSRAGSAGARNQTARLVASDGETDVTSQGDAEVGTASASPTYYNPSLEGLEGLTVTDPREFEPTLDTLAAWVATFASDEAYPDRVREAWAADPEGCAAMWGILQRRRAIQEAFSLYELRQVERHKDAVDPVTAIEEFRAIVPELARWHSVPGEDVADYVLWNKRLELLDMFDRLSADVQINIWGYGEEIDTPGETSPAYGELIRYISEGPEVRRAAEWLHGIITTPAEIPK